MFWKIVSLSPIGSYPVTRDFGRRTTIVIIAFVSLLVYIGLTIWNVLTQGKNKTFSTVLRTNYTDNAKEPCQPATIAVGDSLFSSPFGTFDWTIIGVSGGNSSLGFPYIGSNMTQANITYASLTFYWPEQSYSYTMCAEAFVPTIGPTKGNSTGVVGPDTSISMSTFYSLTSPQLPKWTTTNQDSIQNRVFGLTSYLPQLNFTNGSLPSFLFPPYDLQGTPHSDQSVSPEKAYDLSVWMDGLYYLPNANSSSTAPDITAVHKVIVNNSSMSFLDAFEQTSGGISNTSGFNIGLNGIGALHLSTQKQNTAHGFTEPKIFTDLRTIGLDDLNMLMDGASSDLNNRILGESYLCTQTGEEWKPPLSIIALILGNNAALFGFALGLLVSAAKWYEQSKGYIPVSAMNESYQPVAGRTPDMRDFELGAAPTRTRSSDRIPILGDAASSGHAAPASSTTLSPFQNPPFSPSPMTSTQNLDQYSYQDYRNPYDSPRH